MPNLPFSIPVRLRVLPVPLFASLLFAGCSGLPVPTQEHSGFSQSASDGASFSATRQAAAPDWAGLQRELEAALRETPGNRIAHLPEGLRASLPAADGFAPGQAELRPALAALLQRVVPVFQRHAWASIRIVGHTDSQGSEMRNLDLSFRRAEAVAEYLRQQGIGLGRLSADGRGEADPIADNAKAEGRARNRRIDIFLNPR
ncbi:MAG: OmpA family protein [Azoarcus sp.]|jgi:outer membrane protein OmpA-like peptidoglycan-associated protein|nr:OmpA family protein [Azoarcus sp.]